MMRITRVETNIKHPGGIVLKDFTSRVFLTGSNGSGKTSILNAIQLALTGEAHDLGVKDKAKVSTTLKYLIPEGEESLYARVEVTCDRTDTVHFFEWTLTPGKKAKRSQSPDAPKVNLLIPEIESAIRGSKLTMLRFLAKYFGTNDIITGQNDRLKGGIDTPWNERILLTEALARKSMNQHKASAKALRTALTQLGHSGDSPPGNDARTIVASSIVTLTGFQLEHNLSTCGVCGHDTHEHVLRDRHTKAKSKVGDLRVSSRISALQYAAEQSDRQARKAEELVDYCLMAMEQDIVARLPEVQAALDKATPQHGGNFRLCRSKAGMYFTLNEDPLVSGAESTWLLTAIACAIVNRDPMRHFHLVTTPDRAFDHKSIAAFLKTFGNPAGVDQIFVQCPIQPRGRLSTKWCKIDLDEEHKNA